jgi:hypothetical protein
MKTSTFFPAIAELRRDVAAAVLDLPTPEAAWAEIRQGFSDGGIYREPGWSCAPLAEAVRAIGWRTLCLSPEADPHIFERLQRTYEAYVARFLQTVDIGAVAAGLTAASRLAEPDKAASP